MTKVVTDLGSPLFNMLAARLLVAVLAALACAAGAVQAADSADTLVVYPLARYAVEGNTAVHGLCCRRDVPGAAARMHC